MNLISHCGLYPDVAVLLQPLLPIVASVCAKAFLESGSVQSVLALIPDIANKLHDHVPELGIGERLSVASSWIGSVVSTFNRLLDLPILGVEANEMGHSAVAAYDPFALPDTGIVDEVMVPHMRNRHPPRPWTIPMHATDMASRVGGAVASAVMPVAVEVADTGIRALLRASDWSADSMAAMAVPVFTSLVHLYNGRSIWAARRVPSAYMQSIGGWMTEEELARPVNQLLMETCITCGEQELSKHIQLAESSGTTSLAIGGLFTVVYTSAVAALIIPGTMLAPVLAVGGSTFILVTGMLAILTDDGFSSPRVALSALYHVDQTVRRGIQANTIDLRDAMKVHADMRSHQVKEAIEGREQLPELDRLIIDHKAKIDHEAAFAQPRLMPPPPSMVPIPIPMYTNHTSPLPLDRAPPRALQLDRELDPVPSMYDSELAMLLQQKSSATRAILADDLWKRVDATHSPSRSMLPYRVATLATNVVDGVVLPLAKVENARLVRAGEDGVYVMEMALPHIDPTRSKTGALADNAETTWRATKHRFFNSEHPLWERVDIVLTGYTLSALVVMLPIGLRTAHYCCSKKKQASALSATGKSGYSSRLSPRSRVRGLIHPTPPHLRADPVTPLLLALVSCM